MRNRNNIIRSWSLLTCVFFTICSLSCNDDSTTATGAIDNHSVTDGKHLKQEDAHSPEEHQHNHDESEKNHNETDGEQDHANHEHNEKSDRALSKDGTAVIRASKKQGIQLSAKAQKTIGIRLQPLTQQKKSTGNEYLVPRQSLVYYEHSVGLYLKRGNWFNLQAVTVIRQNKKNIRIKAALLKPGDLIVIKGAPLLRLAHLEAFGASGHGHGH